MASHPVTEPMRQVILRAMRQRKISQAELAARLGLGKPWMTKLLDGTLRTIKVSVMHQIEEELEINFFAVELASTPPSPLAEKIAAMVDCDPLFAKLAQALEEAITAARGAFTPRYLRTQEMAKVGRQIAEIVDANRDKPGKIAREVLALLS